LIDSANPERLESSRLFALIGFQVNPNPKAMPTSQWAANLIAGFFKENSN
jgi:hypothetical protein